MAGLLRFKNSLLYSRAGLFSSTGSALHSKDGVFPSKDGPLHQRPGQHGAMVLSRVTISIDAAGNLDLAGSDTYNFSTEESSWAAKLDLARVWLNDRLTQYIDQTRTGGPATTAPYEEEQDEEEEDGNSEEDGGNGLDNAEALKKPRTH